MDNVNELSALAQPEMARLWSLPLKYTLERQWWTSVMEIQRVVGVDIDRSVIDDYWRATSERIDLDSIRDRELVTRHDVKARLEEFNAVAGGHQHAHKGMTGRDLDDNVELIQARRALLLLADQADLTGNLDVADDLRREADGLPLRGIWGPVGTGADQLDLLGGSLDMLTELNREMARLFGFQPDRVMDSVGQVYPRSIDYGMAARVASCLSRAGAAPGFGILARGYVAMLSQLAGDQWLEGDVSCSVVRRVAIANLFLTASAALSTPNPTRKRNGLPPMAWYWYAIAYVVGYLGAWRVGYSIGMANSLDDIERENLRIRHYNKNVRHSFQHRDERVLTVDDHKDNAAFTAMIAMFWPLLAIGVPAYLFVTQPTRAEIRHDKREAERVELAALRKQAEELGLPFPDPTIERNG